MMYFATYGMNHFNTTSTVEPVILDDVETSVNTVSRSQEAEVSHVARIQKAQEQVEVKLPSAPFTAPVTSIRISGAEDDHIQRIKKTTVGKGETLSAVHHASVPCSARASLAEKCHIVFESIIRFHFYSSQNYLRIYFYIEL